MHWIPKRESFGITGAGSLKETCPSFCSLNNVTETNTHKIRTIYTKT